MEEPTASVHSEQTVDKEFKKPILIGRIGKLPRKAKQDIEPPAEKTEKNIIERSTSDKKKDLPPAILLKELSTPIPYKEPKWSGLCPDGSEYALEVLKSGMIMETVQLTTKPYYVFGRLANCDVIMAHPTISRHHAVLQYKAFADEGEPPAGWYLFDLGSTHCTYLNREKLKSSHYTRVRVGHQIKFGNSTRTYIMLGPDFDSEGESELTVTEIKQRAADMKKERERIIQEAIQQREMDRLAEEKKREEQGIDWGMGEDAEDETDLADNPYASTMNEELYLTDPKKSLRGYFEREGHELQYDCEERGVGQFMCRVQLPLDDARGRSVVAEVLHKGKKKEAVVACALEACRILDRAGVLRQAEHESRRRKAKDWSADDYYDSDDDNYLDRTGSVERKRKLRMRKHGAEQEEKALTYDDLIKQISDIEGRIKAEERTLERLRPKSSASEDQSSDLDALDQFMTQLKQAPSVADKAEISKTKMSIQKLKTELLKTQRLAEIARPADLPRREISKMAVKTSNSIVYGKRLKLKTDEKRPKPTLIPEKPIEEFVEEMDSDEDAETPDKIEPVFETPDKIEPVFENPDKIEPVIVNQSKPVLSQPVQPKPVVERSFGPMRPPKDYVIPDNYFEQESDRDLPEIEDN